MYNKFLLLSTVVLLSSCTLGPDYKRPQFFPDNDIATSLHLSGATQNIDRDWYKQFNDPFLNTLIARGLQNSPDIGVAIEKLRQSRQTLRINRVEYLPNIDATGSYNYNKGNNNSGLPLSSDYYQAGFDASWEIDIWGAGRRLTEESLALLRGASANFDNVRLSLTAEIANNYFSLRQAQEQLSIAKQTQKLQQDIYQLVKDKYDVGLADDIALNQAKYLLKTTLTQIPDLQASVSSYQNSLSVLVGQLPEQLNSLLSNHDNNSVRKIFSFDINKVSNLPIDILRQRPDVRIAEENLIAQNAKIGQAIAALFPSVSLSGFLGWQSEHLSQLISSKTDLYSYSPTINLPLFHWGALVNNVDLQKSITKQQLNLYKSSLLNAALDIRNSMIELEQEYKKNSYVQQALKAQQQVRELTLVKYKQGLLEFSDVLTAEQNYLTAQNNKITSNTAIYQNIISFYKAIGGGYSNDFSFYQIQ